MLDYMFYPVPGYFISLNGGGGGSGGTVSNAITSNTPFQTQVGPYLMTYTSNGGFIVSGGGVALQVSSGAIIASGSGGEFVNIVSGAITARADDGVGLATVSLSPSGVDIQAAGGGVKIALEKENTAVEITDDGVLVNSRPVATQLVTSTSDDPSALIGVLSGGTNYVYTGSLYQVDVSSVVKTTEASYLHFTLDSVTAPTPVVLSGVSYLNSATFEGGKEYLVGIFDGMAVVNEVTSGGVV